MLFRSYRYYDTSKVRVLFPFGYGLSYTEFEYSDLSVSAEGVAVTIKNTGKMDGSEVVQLYVGLPNAKVFRPEKELKGFKKVSLKAGESQVVKIPFDDKTFRYFNVTTNQWEIEGGNYTIYVGANVADIKLLGHYEVAGTTENVPYQIDRIPSYYSGIIQEVSDKEFEEILGYTMPSGKWSGELKANDALCQIDRKSVV